MTSEIFFNNSKEHHLDQDCPEKQVSAGCSHHLPSSLEQLEVLRNSTHLHSPLWGITHHLASSGKGNTMTHRRGVQETWLPGERCDKMSQSLLICCQISLETDGPKSQ